jgi:maltodextrin utilization protein YvdJ
MTPTVVKHLTQHGSPINRGCHLPNSPEREAELLPALSPAASLRELVAHWWHANQLWIAWTLLVVPLVLELIYGTFLLLYLILAPISILATYFIYRSARSRLQSKTNELEALSQLHLATAEALATAIDAKDQTTHCHVRRVQIYAAGNG